MVAPNPPPRDYRRETADLWRRQRARNARRSCDGLQSAKDLSELFNIGRKERLNAMAAGRLDPPDALCPCPLWAMDAPLDGGGSDD